MWDNTTILSTTYAATACITAHQQDHSWWNYRTHGTSTTKKQLSLQLSGLPKPEQKCSPTFYFRNSEIRATHVSPSESFARNWSWEMLANLFSSCSTCHWKNDLPNCVVFLATLWGGRETFKVAKETLRSRLLQTLLGARLKFWAWGLTVACGWALVKDWRGAEMFSEPSESFRREEKLCEGQYCSSWPSKACWW